MFKKGFTLIELLVVIAIIGLLATMVAASLKNPQAKSRDARRVADIKQIRSALELYFSDVNFYPTGTIATVAQNGTLGVSPRLMLSSTNGFNTSVASATYMGKVPADPGVDSGYVYTYASTNGSTYTITFGLTGKTGSLTCGTYSATCCTASPAGITCT